MNTRVQLSGVVCRVVGLRPGLEKAAIRIDTVDWAINVNSLFTGSIEEGITS